MNYLAQRGYLAWRGAAITRACLLERWNRSDALRTVFAMVGGNLVATMVAIVGTLVQARFVGPQDLGYFGQFGIFTSYALFLHLGLFDALQRLYPLYVGGGRRDKALMAAEICQSWNVCVSGIVSGSFCLISLLAFARGNWRAGLAWGAQATAVAGFIYGGYLSATYRSGHDFVTVVKGTVVGSLASLFTLPCFAFFPYIALVLRSSLGNVANLVYLHPRRPLRLGWRFNLREWYSIAKQGIPMFAASYGTTTGWAAVEATLAVRCLGTSALGLWTFSFMFLDMINKLPQAIGAVYTPRLMAEYGRTGSVRACLRMCRRPIAWGIVPVFLVAGSACFVLPALLPWLMPKYVAALSTMCLMTLHLPLIILQMPYQIIVAKGHWLRMNIFSYTALVCFVGFGLLAVRVDLGLNGIVVASLLGRIIRLAMIYAFVVAEARRERFQQEQIQRSQG